MTRRALPFRIGARAALVLAALLQLAGAAGGPWAHTHGRQADAGPQLCAADHRGDHHGPTSHDELSCGVWQVLSAAAAPVSGVALVPERDVQPRSDAAPPAQAPAPLLLSPPARGPPHG